MTFRVLLSLKPSQIDIDAVDEDGWTPLHAAIYWGNMDVATQLVDHGADVDKKTTSVSTIAHMRGTTVYTMALVQFKLTAITKIMCNNQCACTYNLWELS